MLDPALSVQAVITDDLREWLMKELRYPVLAINTPDGAPSQSVMWFDLDPERPDTVIMNTKAERAKSRFLRRDPRVSLCFEEGETWVALRGAVELDDDPERSMEVILALARRYGGAARDFSGQHRVTIRMRVEKVIRHD
jgi:PPOX class probable F420-dependent enzyme